MAVTVMADAAQSATDAYVAMYESLCEQQQTDIASRRPLRARKAGYMAHITRRAIDAELEDPDPPDRPYRLCCSGCTAFRASLGGH